MRFTTSKGLLASLAVAGAMVGGLLLTPASAQDQGDKGDAKPASITVSGTALLPDGSPAAKFPVALKAIEKRLIGPGGEGGGGDAGAPPPDLLSQGSQGAAGKGGKGAKGAKGEGGVYKTIGRGVCDESGRFAVKCTTTGQGDHTIVVEIGEVGKTPSLRQTVPTKGKDVDMGNVTLNPVGK